MSYCAFGPCDKSIESGGAGCRLCDIIAKLPQPSERVMSLTADRLSNKKQKNDRESKTAAAKKPRTGSLW